MLNKKNFSLEDTDYLTCEFIGFFVEPLTTFTNQPIFVKTCKNMKDITRE